MSFTKLSTMFSSLRTRMSQKLSRQESPRLIQERKDIYIAMLASTFRQNRIRARDESFRNTDGGAECSSLEALYDKSESELESMSLPSMTIVELRRLLQQRYGTEVTSIFKGFETVENKLRAGRIPLVKDLLGREYKEDEKLIWEYGKEGRDSSFLRRKRCAIKNVLDYKDWRSDVIGDDDDDDDNVAIDNVDDEDDNIDAFGNHQLICDDIVIRALRNAQIMNLSKAALLKEEFGYSTLALRSTIPNAGKGLFVNGGAMAGSILAFFPGEVWPREHLINRSVNSHFANDDNFQLSIRYDDIIVDSRSSPYNILDANPWALAHTVNHPPAAPAAKPNCRALTLNYTRDMGLDDDLVKFVPNVYARKPYLLTPAAAHERDDVLMHGLMLVAERDVLDEELFYDYRFNDVEGMVLPEWYVPCDAEETKSRWAD
eukprot:CAMPEP_0172512194 /NCGR_PEP_ID=MMETSP1066-20121228/242359_1 /TAXON_ID=671091 /ORGANISM="Coscinodiscus wailesii, Strain CCMP2513" /LENGTH=430 /DNA_ID=CAMNT_0013291885 /DNA_START=168 /DNA_END=1460 /DNA_ORIENTATION=-